MWSIKCKWFALHDKTNVNTQCIFLLINLTKSSCSVLAFCLFSWEGTKKKTLKMRWQKCKFLTREKLMQFAKSPSHDFICYCCLVFLSNSQKLLKIIKDYIWEKESGLCSLLDKVRDGLSLFKQSHWAFVPQGITCHLHTTTYHSILIIHIPNSKWILSLFKDSDNEFSS